MAKNTKERILSAALDLFSRSGYAGTNIRELTASLGLVKSSMYKHFQSKEEILEALRDEMIAYYDARFGSPVSLPYLSYCTASDTYNAYHMVRLFRFMTLIVLPRRLALTPEAVISEYLRPHTFW